MSKNQLKITINVEEIKKGLIKKIGVVEFGVLLAIASFCDEFNMSSVSQREIAKCTGLSLPTTNKAVNSLLEKKVNGEFIIKRDMLSYHERNKCSVYRLNLRMIKVC